MKISAKLAPISASVTNSTGFRLVLSIVEPGTLPHDLPHPAFVDGSVKCQSIPLPSLRKKKTNQNKIREVGAAIA